MKFELTFTFVDRQCNTGTYVQDEVNGTILERKKAAQTSIDLCHRQIMTLGKLYQQPLQNCKFWSLSSGQLLRSYLDPAGFRGFTLRVGYSNLGPPGCRSRALPLSYIPARTTTTM